MDEDSKKNAETEVEAAYAADQAEDNDAPAEQDPAAKPRGKPFAKNTSGNAAGRPRGALGKKTLAAQAALESHIEAIAVKGRELALAGNASMIKFCLSRGLPKPGDNAVVVDIPKLTTPTACREAIQRVVEASAAGEITLQEADKLGGAIEVVRLSFRSIEWEATFEERRASLVFQQLVEEYPPSFQAPDDKKNWDAFYDALLKSNLAPGLRRKLWVKYNDLLGVVSERLFAEQAARKKSEPE